MLLASRQNFSAIRPDPPGTDQPVQTVKMMRFSRF
jgi:hypothetical protein